MAVTFYELREEYDITKLQTKIEFEIPYHLLLPEGEIFSFIYHGHQIQLSGYSISAGNRPLEVIHGFYYAIYDKYGLINHTKIFIEADYYMAKNYLPSADSNEMDERRFIFQEATRIYNCFLSIYKNATGTYWLNELNCYMNTGYDFQIFCQGECVFSGFQLGRGDTIVSLDPLCLSEEKKEKLLQLLSEQDFKYWETALLHAKDSQLIGNYREVILWINIALENFVRLYSEPILSNHMSANELENFYNGTVGGNKQTKSARPPSVYVIFKRTCSYFTRIEYKKIELLVNTIRKNRNDIVHGKKFSDDELEKTAYNAINSFNNLVQYCLL